jgi:hypothetical protein
MVGFCMLSTKLFGPDQFQFTTTSDVADNVIEGIAQVIVPPTTTMLGMEISEITFICAEVEHPLGAVATKEYNPASVTTVVPASEVKLLGPVQ